MAEAGGSMSTKSFAVQAELVELIKGRMSEHI
ncbi:hypothetical protein ACVINW_003879 [Bradyrhizobium sp. USDA 4461]